MASLSHTLSALFNTIADRGQLIQPVQQQQQVTSHYLQKILLTEAEAALLLHVSKSFLRDHRYQGGMPSYYKLGNTIRYDYFELMDYLESCRGQRDGERRDA